MLVNTFESNQAPLSRMGSRLIAVFAALSIFGGAMGGFGVGLVLGLIGGMLGITWKPTESQIKK